MPKRRARLTELEREALDIACNEIFAGDAEEYFNGGCQVSHPPETPEQERAIKLARALASAQMKL